MLYLTLVNDDVTTFQQVISRLTAMGFSPLSAVLIAATAHIEGQCHITEATEEEAVIDWGLYKPLDCFQWLETQAPIMLNIDDPRLDDFEPGITAAKAVMEPIVVQKEETVDLDERWKKLLGKEWRYVPTREVYVTTVPLPTIQIPGLVRWQRTITYE